MRKRLLAMLLVIAMIIPMGTCLPVSASSSDKLTLLSATAIDNWTIELKFSEDLKTEENGDQSWLLNKFSATSQGVTAGLVLVSDEKTVEKTDATTGDSLGYWYDIKKEFFIPGTISLGETADTLRWKVTSPGETTSLSYLKDSLETEEYSLKFAFKDIDSWNYHNSRGYINVIMTADGSKGLSIPDEQINTTNNGVAWEYLFIDIDTSSANFELLSATVLNDYQIELKFSQELRTVLIDTDADTVADTPWIEQYAKTWGGLVQVSNEKTATDGYYEIGTKKSGTVSLGDDNKTLIWTASEKISQIQADLAKEGYSVKFYFYEGGNSWFVANNGYINNISVVTIQDTYGMPLWIPEDYRKNAGTGAGDYMFMDITPADELELVSVEPIDEYSLKVTFNKGITADTTVNPKANLNANLRLLNADGSLYYYEITNSSDEKQMVDYGCSLGNTMQPTDDPAVWTWRMPAEYAGFGSKDMESNKVKESNRSINYVLDTWEEYTALGYKATFLLLDGSDDGTLDVTDPATYPGYNKRIQAVDGGYLKTTHRSGTNDYVFKEISKVVTDLYLESVTQVGSYQIALKFNQDLRTTDRNGSPFILETISNERVAEVGMAWVKDDWMTADEDTFADITTGAIEGTVALGDTNDTLIWTVDNQIPANFISNLLNETKEGYTRKFYLRDVACGWHGGGKIGAIQAFPNGVEKALVIPDEFIRSDPYNEYYFVDVTPISNPAFELVSVTEIGDYQLELQFSEPVRKTTTSGASWVDAINSNATQLFVAWVSDTDTGATSVDTAVTGDRLLGTVDFGDAEDTLIWTATRQNEADKISALMAETKTGYTKKFVLYDNGCNWHGDGYIGVVQGVPASSGAEKPLRIPEGQGSQQQFDYDYMFVDIRSYADYDQTNVIELKDATYHFMNADTGRSLTVNGNEEFTVERKSGNVISLKVDDQYVNLHSTTPALGETAYNYLLEYCGNERYRLLVTPNLALTDADTGTDNVAALSHIYSGLTPISTGWYLTASGDAKPLRILPIGDSITYGVTSAGNYAHGWRDTLSENLMDQFDRVVFVGSQTSKNSSVNEKALYRHEGNPGWTVSYIQQDVSLDSIATGVVNKYDPDVVLLMAGINDMGSLDAQGKSDDEACAYLKDAYKTLLEKLKANMEEDDVIFCSTLTPTFYASGENNPAVINAVFPSWVKEWAAEGLPVALNDNYTGIEDDSNVCCSDTLHLSSVGDAFVAQQYLNSILNYYNTDGTEMDLQEKINAAKADGLEEFYLNSDESIEEVNVPDAITLDLNGHTLTATYLRASGDLIDSTEGKGLVKIAKNDTADNTHLLEARAENPMLPLYDTANGGGYRFFTCTATQKYNEGTPRFGIQLSINDTGLALLKDAANADVEVVNNIAVTVDDVDIVTKEYVFQASTVATYAEKMLSKDGKNWAIILTVSGFDKLSGTNISMTSTPSVTSSAKVSVAPSENGTVTYTYKQGE